MTGIKWLLLTSRSTVLVTHCQVENAVEFRSTEGRSDGIGRFSVLRRLTSCAYAGASHVRNTPGPVKRRIRSQRVDVVIVANQTPVSFG